MKEDEYLNNRVYNQLQWYDKKSVFNKYFYLSLKILEILFAASIPIITLFDGTKIFIAILGALISIIASILALYKPNEKWKQYRNTTEILKNETNLFLTKSATYNTDSNFKTYVERIEYIISKENSNWTQLIGLKDNILKNENS